MSISCKAKLMLAVTTIINPSTSTNFLAHSMIEVLHEALWHQQVFPFPCPELCEQSHTVQEGL